MSPLPGLYRLFLILFCSIVNQGFVEEQRFGTKTPYKPAGNLQDVKSPPGCLPVHLNMVIRHGSRFPSSSSMKKLTTLLKKLNEVHKSGFKYKNLTLPWGLPFLYHTADGSELSQVGEQEQYGLGKRFRARYTDIFGYRYWNKFYTFISTDKERTARSAAAFSYGLFEGKGLLGNSSYQPIPIKFSGPKDNDKLLRYYDTCPKYKAEIEEGNGMDEWKAFGKGPEMKQLIATMEERLKIKGKISLTAEDIEELLMMCAASKLSITNREWCSLFTNKDIDVLNYWIDLENFYSNSYGNDISYKTSCPLLADITKTLDNTKLNSSFSRGIFRFTHSGTVLALESLLELYKESVKFTSSQYQQNINRKFRSYKMIPMAANIAFVLHKCSGGEYKVQLLVNEKLTSLPCCMRNGQETCSLDTFKKCYEYKNCDFDAMCKVAPSSGCTRLLSMWWQMMVIVSTAFIIKTIV